MTTKDDMSDGLTANEVRLVGRVSGRPEERVLPSGDRLMTFRVVVTRDPPRGRQTVDALSASPGRPAADDRCPAGTTAT